MRATQPTLFGLVRRVPQLFSDRAEFFLGLAEEHGDVVRLPIPGRPLYLVSAPALVQHVLQSHADRYKKSFDIEIARELLGRGLVTTEGDAFRANRAIVAKAFRGVDLSEMTTRMQAVVDRWAASLGSARTTRIEASSTFTKLTLAMLAEVILGVSAARDPDGLMDAFLTSLRFIERRLVAPFDIDALVRTPARVEHERALSTMNAQIDAWIEEVRSGRNVSRGVLSFLVEAADARTDMTRADREVWLRDEVRTLLLAGHETSAVGLAWMTMELAARPALQASLAGEDEESRPRVVAVVEETLRLHPPVWSLGREARVDDQLGDVSIPRGSTIILSPYVTHRLSRIWTDGGSFVPDRFLRARPPHAYAFFPFSGGGRRCLGERLAMLEMRLVAETLFRGFEVRRTDERPVGREALISLRPSRDIGLELTPRR